MPDLESRLREQFDLVRQDLRLSPPDLDAVFAPPRHRAFSLRWLLSLRALLGAIVVAAAVGTPFLVEAVAGHHPSHPHEATPSTTNPPPPSTAPPTGSTICTAADLRISLGGGLAGLGNIYVAIEFRNVTTSVCSMTGYPGVAGLDAAGDQIAQAVRSPSGMFGGLPQNETTPTTVILSPGQTASAQIEDTDNPVNGAASCPFFSGVLVTPPNDTHSVMLPVYFPDCTQLQVHPVVIGTTGSIPPAPVGPSATPSSLGS